MNWDFVAILKFSQSGTNRRLWDRGIRGIRCISREHHVNVVTSYKGPTGAAIFSARQHNAELHAIAIPSVRLSVRPSHGWISQKRLKLGSCNFHLQ